MIAQNLEAVRERIVAACAGCGRDPREVTLVAVSKVKPAADIVEAYEAGQRDFGENYIQEFQDKSRALPDLPGARFHFIGHLQSNKTRIAAELFHAVHTVDSEKLARRLNDQTERPLDVFLEVKLSPEDSKNGADPADVPALAQFVGSCENLRLRGLMTMPPWSEDPEVARPYFRRLRALRDELGLPDLSMGMSHDLETAIQEGSTLVRIGTAIFGKRIRPQ
ncbi:MAG: YggS family pyridoxal phosphate-dependent enzyme [Acidobacteria bacterium]|nr:YggS family pyridoxal phosphate-dependent enzyme [Acidobacteriota bacterium]